MQLDGTQISLVTNTSEGIINVVDEWIYFKNPQEDDLLYKIKIDGSNLQIVN